MHRSATAYNHTEDESKRFLAHNLFVNACYFPEHEGPLSLVSVSSDSLLVLGATSTGNLGFLDVRTRRYSTLMRSHTDTVRSFCVDGIRRHLATASSDGTVRIWNMDSLHQVNRASHFIIACY